MKRSGRFGYWDNDMKSKPQQVDTTKYTFNIANLISVTRKTNVKLLVVTFS